MTPNTPHTVVCKVHAAIAETSAPFSVERDDLLRYLEEGLINDDDHF
jgi:hypothetical protein